MKVSYRWLETHFKEEIKAPEKIAELLTMHAFEVEEVKPHGDDFILDVKVLPDRTHDCLSHRGIAREINVLSKAPLTDLSLDVVTSKDFQTKERLSLYVDADKCNRAQKRLVQNVKVGHSPAWLVERLESVGQKSINNIVDAANFCMLETGQPVHTFDFDKIAGKENKKISVREALEGERVRCLDGKEYVLEKGMLVIADEERALDIAGIKGGLDSGIDEKTTTVLLSVCNFDAIDIRATSKKLGLRTDASHRFESGISPGLVPVGMELLSKLVSEIAQGEVSEDIIDVYPLKQKDHAINISVVDVSRALGFEISEKEIKEICDRAGILLTQRSSGSFVAKIPELRLDMRIKEDLIEEIARLYGYEHVKSVPLEYPNNDPKVNKQFFYEQKIKHFLINKGFSEVYTYTFANEGVVELQNPLASDKKFLRESLLPHVEKSLIQASNQADLLGLDEVRIFEIGKVFTKKGEHTSFVIALKCTKKQKETESEILADVITELGSELKIKLPEINPGENMIEINLDEIIKKLPEPRAYESHEKTGVRKSEIKYKKFSPYPYIVRDVAVFVPTDISKEIVENIIIKEAGDLALHVRLFDEFTKKLPDGSSKTSFGFRIVFQSQDRTLTDAEVNSVMSRVSDALGNQSDWQVR